MTKEIPSMITLMIKIEGGVDYRLRVDFITGMIRRTMKSMTRKAKKERGVEIRDLPHSHFTE